MSDIAWSGQSTENRIINIGGYGRIHLSSRGTGVPDLSSSCAYCTIPFLYDKAFLAARLSQPQPGRAGAVRIFV